MVEQTGSMIKEIGKSGEGGFGSEFARAFKTDGGFGKDFADAFKNDGEGTESGGGSEKTGLTDGEKKYGYLTETQIDTIKQTYKELGYSEEQIEAKLQEYEKKARACKEAEEKGLDNLSRSEKGCYGEMKTDLDMLDKGYVRIQKDGITSLKDKMEPGIDGVYENPHGKPRYAIVEAKYGNSELKNDSKDGRQMSENWIDKRLDGAVGKKKADEIRMAEIENPDNVGKSVARVDPEGNVTYTDVDKDGKYKTTSVLNNRNKGD